MSREATQFKTQSPNVKHDLFSQRTIESVWLAGLIAADGCILPKGNAWRLQQSGASGKDLMEEVQAIVGRELPPSRRPTAGQDAYSICISSRRMVEDLNSIYLITSRKTTTLEFPELPGKDLPVFMRGYVDGDGCVGTYKVGRGSMPMLHTSVVGTQHFIEKFHEVSPIKGNVNQIKRCLNLYEIRWNGRYAWDFAEWLYQHEAALPISAKAQKYFGYREKVLETPPVWYTRRAKKVQGLRLLEQGVRYEEIAERVGITVWTVYKWASALR